MKTWQKWQAIGAFILFFPLVMGIVFSQWLFSFPVEERMLIAMGLIVFPSVLGYLIITFKTFESIWERDC